MLIQTAGLRLNVVDEGPRDAPVVMLSHSLGANLTMWAPQAAALTSEFRVIRYDTRGHGQSDAPESPYTLAELGGDVVALLDTLDIERVHFVGLSLGGMTALGLALEYPARIASICAANCTAQTPDGGEAMWDERIAVARSQGMAVLVEATLARWFTADMLATRKDEVAAVRDMIRATPVAGYAGSCEAIAKIDERQVALESKHRTPERWRDNRARLHLV